MSVHHDRRLERLFGSGDVDDVFHGDTALVPWPRHPRRPEPEALEAVRALLHTPVHLFDVDPRLLLATQLRLVRHHFRYYADSALGGSDYLWFGRTSADPGSVLNRFPVVQPNGDGRYILRSGHHRAAAALLNGTPLRCRIVGHRPLGDAVAVTPRLLVGAEADVRAVTPDDLKWAGADLPVAVADWIRGEGATVVVPSAESAHLALLPLGCDPQWAATLLRRSFPDSPGSRLAPPAARPSGGVAVVDEDAPTIEVPVVEPVAPESDAAPPWPGGLAATTVLVAEHASTVAERLLLRLLIVLAALFVTLGAIWTVPWGEVADAADAFAGLAPWNRTDADATPRGSAAADHEPAPAPQPRSPRSTTRNWRHS